MFLAFQLGKGRNLRGRARSKRPLFDAHRRNGAVTIPQAAFQSAPVQFGRDTK